MQEVVQEVVQGASDASEVGVHNRGTATGEKRHRPDCDEEEKRMRRSSSFAQKSLHDHVPHASRVPLAEARGGEGDLVGVSIDGEGKLGGCGPENSTGGAGASNTEARSFTSGSAEGAFAIPQGSMHVREADQQTHADAHAHNTHTHTHTDTHTHTTLSLQDSTALKALSTKLKSLRAHAAESDMPSALNAVMLLKPLDEALRILDLSHLPDEVLVVVGKVLLSEGAGLKQASTYMSVVLFPKLQALTQPASRALLSAVLHAAKEHPRAAEQSIVLRFLASHEFVGTSQVAYYIYVLILLCVLVLLHVSSYYYPRVVRIRGTPRMLAPPR